MLCESHDPTQQLLSQVSVNRGCLCGHVVVSSLEMPAPKSHWEVRDSNVHSHRGLTSAGGCFLTKVSDRLSNRPFS